jgi:hypothetical protein
MAALQTQHPLTGDPDAARHGSMLSCCEWHFRHRDVLLGVYPLSAHDVSLYLYAEIDFGQRYHVPMSFTEPCIFKRRAALRLHWASKYKVAGEPIYK